MNKAAIVIVEGDYATVTEEWFENDRVTASSAYGIEPSEQLLADLREAASACALVAATSSGPRAQYWDDLAARVRALLPEEGEDE